jgi:hypothetical protein
MNYRERVRIARLRRIEWFAFGLGVGLMVAFIW